MKKPIKMTIEELRALVKSTIEENRNAEDGLKPLTYEYPDEYKDFDIKDFPSEGVEYDVDFLYEECYEEITSENYPDRCYFSTSDENEWKRHPAYLRYLFEFELLVSNSGKVYIHGGFLHTITDNNRWRRDEWILS